MGSAGGQRFCRDRRPAVKRCSVLRREVYCDAVAELGGEAVCFVSRSQREFDPMGMRWDLETEVDRWPRKLPKPVGVFAPNDVWGVQVVLACRCADLRVPEDVAVPGVDDVTLYPH